MEEQFTSLDALFEFGKCIYNTNYRGFTFAVTITNVTDISQFYNFVFDSEDLEKNIYKMLDLYVENQECDFLKVAMSEVLPRLDLQISQLPVVVLNALTVEIKASKVSDCYRFGNQITTSFEAFKA
jgi:hypothetical protein